MVASQHRDPAQRAVRIDGGIQKAGASGRLSEAREAAEDANRLEQGRTRRRGKIATLHHGHSGHGAAGVGAVVIENECVAGYGGDAPDGLGQRSVTFGIAPIGFCQQNVEDDPRRTERSNRIDEGRQDRSGP